MIYVCSDVHGCGERFYKLIERINLKDTDTLHILGDLIDRNPDGIELLKYVMSHENIKLLMGNHEEFMYSYLVNLNVLGKLDTKDNFPYNIWLSSNNGGMETLKKFAEEPIEVKEEIIKYLSELPLIINCEVNGKKFHLSHAGTFQGAVDKNVWYVSDVSKSKREAIVWYCPYRNDTYLPEYCYPDGYTSIIGHVPVQRINNDNGYAIHKYYDIDKEIYNVDSGCAMLSKEKDSEFIKTALSCLCLDTMEEFYIR